MVMNKQAGGGVSQRRGRHGMDDGLSPAFLTVLRELHKRLTGADIDWAVTGSCGFAVHGVPIEPNDIDIQTDKAGAYRVQELFAESVTRPVRLCTSVNIRSHLGALRLEGVQVEIMGDVQKRCGDGTWEAPVNVGRHKQLIEVEGVQVPVLSLEYEREAYSLLGRSDKVRLLELHLRGVTGSSG